MPNMIAALALYVLSVFWITHQMVVGRTPFRPIDAARAFGALAFASLLYLICLLMLVKT